MKIKGFKLAVGLAVVCQLLIFSAFDASYAQGRRSRTPGRTGNNTSPAIRVKDRESKRTEELTPEFINNEFDKFPGISQELNTDVGSLRSEFAVAHASNRDLVPGQFLAARLLVGIARVVRPDSRVTVGNLLASLKERKSFRETLQSEGLSRDQAEEAMRRLKDRMKELRRS